VDNPDPVNLLNSINDIFFMCLVPCINSDISHNRALPDPDNVHSTNVSTCFTNGCCNLSKHTNLIYYFESKCYAVARAWCCPHRVIIQLKSYELKVYNK